MTALQFRTGTLCGKPEFRWTSDWKYKADGEEIKTEYDTGNWLELEKPTSLEEAGIFELLV